MRTGRLLRAHQSDRDQNVGTVGRERSAVVRELIGQIEQSAADDPSRELLPALRSELEKD